MRVSLIPVLGTLLALAVVMISGGSARRKGRLDARTYRVLVAILLVCVAASLVLALRGHR